MSKKAAANPLLIRHRYFNPFPPPPFPPKLLHISTDPARYAGYRFLSRLENEREIPVLADADLGMPIELGVESDGGYGLGAYWEGDRSVVCPDPSAPPPQLEPDDLALLVDPAPVPGSAISIANGAGQHPRSVSQPGSTLGSNSSNPHVVSSERRKTEVSWLRRTEYFNEVQHKSRESMNSQKVRTQVQVVPKTKSERLAEIHTGFDEVQKPLETLKHPTKSHLTPVESFEFLPNESVWPNSYDLYRFQENPSDQLSSSNAQLIDPRLDFGILRGMVTVTGEESLVYFLPATAEGALSHKKLKLNTKTVDEFEENENNDENKSTENQEDKPACTLKHVREYEVGQSRSMNQYLLVFDDGEQSGKKAAYYNPIANFRTLRKRRPKAHGSRTCDQYSEDWWDVINLTLSNDAQTIQSVKATRSELLLEPPPTT